MPGGLSPWQPRQLVADPPPTMLQSSMSTASTPSPGRSAAVAIASAVASPAASAATASLRHSVALTAPAGSNRIPYTRTRFECTAAAAATAEMRPLFRGSSSEPKISFTTTGWPCQRPAQERDRLRIGR